MEWHICIGLESWQRGVTFILIFLPLYKKWEIESLHGPL